MTSKKNRFLTFCFSFLPGAGEMYMGFMKMGLSLMTIFFGIVAIASVLDLSPFILLGFIAWFYSFFHVHNLASLSDEEFYAIEDDYLFFGKDSSFDVTTFKNHRQLIAIILIIVGVLLLWNGVIDTLYAFLPEFLNNILSTIGYRIPKLIFGVVIIYIGVRMIKGKKASLDEEAKKLTGDVYDPGEYTFHSDADSAGKFTSANAGNTESHDAASFDSSSQNADDSSDL